MIVFGAERDLPVIFCGGISTGHCLEEFKCGSANREEHRFTSELVSDTEASAALTAELAPEGDSGFFPPYRA